MKALKNKKLIPVPYFCGSKRVFYVACQRHSLGGSLLVDIRTGPAVHPAVAGRGLFVVRGPDLPLGCGVVVSGSLRPAGGVRFPPREARTGHGVPAEPVPRRDVVEPGDRLSEHRQRSGLDDSLHVSAGRGRRDDVFLPRTRFGVDLRGDRHVDRRRGAAVAGQRRFLARRHDAGDRFGDRLGRRLRRLHRGRAPEPRGGDRLHGADLLRDGLRCAVFHRRGPADGRRAS